MMSNVPRSGTGAWKPPDKQRQHCSVESHDGRHAAHVMCYRSVLFQKPGYFDPAKTNGDPAPPFVINQLSA